MTGYKGPRIAFLGPEGSYTHQSFCPKLPYLPLTLYAAQATLDTFEAKTCCFEAQITIEDVFAAVQSGDALRGVVPFENSSNGSVVFTLDLFADLQGKYSDIQVCGESYVAVKHCLLGHASTMNHDMVVDDDSSTTGPIARPVCDVSKIQRLYSHPQAWGQCKAFLNRHLKHAACHDVSSTSRAAQLVSQDKSGESAALSSLIAADIFDLDVLAHTINDRIGNTTRFLVLKRRKDDGDASSPATPSTWAQWQDEHAPRGKWKSLVTFTLHHAHPGALAHCLSAFGKFGLNLTSINTRPSGVENWNYIFFVEFESQKETRNDNDNTGPVNSALKELQGVCRQYRWLGTWPNRSPTAH